MQIDAPDQLRVATSIERSFFSLKSSIALLGRSALGRPDMINTKRILSDIKQVRAALDKLEADCQAFGVEQREERAAAKAEVRNSDRRLQTYLEKHPAEIARARKLGIKVKVKPEIAANAAVDGLVAMLAADPHPFAARAKASEGKRHGILALFPHRKAA